MDYVDREAVLRILSEYDVPQVVRTKIKCLPPQNVNSSMKEVLPDIPHDLEKGLGFGIGDVNIRETLEGEYSDKEESIMTLDEKIFLISLILEDVRNNWASNAKSRVRKAKQLCTEIDHPDFKILADRCQDYLNIKERNPDGRFFREDFPRGYYGMDQLHCPTARFNDKSDEFKELVRKYITLPDLAFTDWY